MLFTVTRIPAKLLKPIFALVCYIHPATLRLLVWKQFSQGWICLLELKYPVSALFMPLNINKAITMVASSM